MSQDTPLDPVTIVGSQVEEMLSNWPTLAECLGCANCDKLFRRAPNDQCPFCESVAVFNVGDFLNGISTGMVPRALLEARVKARVHTPPQPPQENASQHR